VRLCLLTLRRLLLCLLLGSLLSALLRKVPADYAPTDRTNDSVVPRVMSGDSAYHRSLEAACGICSAYSGEGERRCNPGDSYRASYHSVAQWNWIFPMWHLLASLQ